jgi:predicted DNA-binding transcriptional regulator YafY
MDTAGRLLRLLSLLQERPDQSAAQLASALGVTTRTVRRDIARLRAFGYPVDASLGRPGYSLGIGSHLPPLLLDDDEVFAIVHGLRLVATAPVSGVDQAALAALAKLDQLLPGRIRERVQAIDFASFRTDGPAEQHVAIDTLIALTTACRERESVHFGYLDHDDARTERRVDPLRLVYVTERWYLFGWDLDRRDWRTFRADRIDHAVTTGHTFHHPDAPDAVQRVLEGIASVGRAVSARVWVNVEPDDARHRYGRFADIEPSGDGNSVLRLASNSLAQIARHMASMSCTWTILEPPELRDEMLRHSRRLAALAGGT